MKTINVEHVPEHVAQALAVVAEHFQRARAAKVADRDQQGRERVKLHSRPGKVIGKLTREEIYEDVG